MFQDGLGTMKHFKANLRVKPRIEPALKRARPIGARWLYQETGGKGVGCTHCSSYEKKDGKMR